jgi:uncharacterized protein
VTISAMAKRIKCPPHHFLCDMANGPVSHAVCSKCGLEKYLENSVKKEFQTFTERYNEQKEEYQKGLLTQIFE